MLIRGKIFWTNYIVYFWYGNFFFKFFFFVRYCQKQLCPTLDDGHLRKKICCCIRSAYCNNRNFLQFWIWCVLSDTFSTNILISAVRWNGLPKWKDLFQHLFSDIRRQVGEICVLMWYYVAYSGNSLQTFRDNLWVRSSRIKKSSIFSTQNLQEMETLAQNIRFHYCISSERRLSSVTNKGKDLMLERCR